MTVSASVSGGGVTPALRELIQANKPVLVAWLNRQVANDLAPGVALDPDRHCWPHSAAMNTAEIDAHAARLAQSYQSTPYHLLLF
jgi:hypothetical protein